MSTWFLDWCWCHGRYGTVIGESFSSRNHISLKNIFSVLLVVTLTSMFVQFPYFSRHLCSYIALLINYWSIPMVCAWSLRHSGCNIPLGTIHCCSNLSIYRKESITLVIILDLIHLTAWAVLPYFWKHIYSLPTRGNPIVVCKFNITTDVLAIRCAWWLGVEVFGIISFF